MLLVYLGWWNISTVEDWRLPWTARTAERTKVSLSFPEGILPFKSLLRLDQTWAMFAPRPISSTGWFVIAGLTASGQLVDVYKKPPFEASFEKPEFLYAEQFDSYRWRKYHARIARNEDSIYRLYYARFLCRDWNENAEGAEKLTDLNMYLMQEMTPPPGAAPVIERVLLWRHSCFNDGEIDQVGKALGFVPS